MKHSNKLLILAGLATSVVHGARVSKRQLGLSFGDTHHTSCLVYMNNVSSIPQTLSISGGIVSGTNLTTVLDNFSGTCVRGCSVNAGTYTLAPDGIVTFSAGKLNVTIDEHFCTFQVTVSEDRGALTAVGWYDAYASSARRIVDFSLNSGRPF